MSFAESIVSMFNQAIRLAYNFLTKDLTEFSPGIANGMKILNEWFQILGFAMLIIFTLWGMSNSSMSHEEFKRPEVMLKYLVGFVMINFIMIKSWDFATTINSLSGGIITTVFEKAGITSGSNWVGIDVPSFNDGGIFGFIADSAASLLTRGISKLPELFVGLVGFCVAAVIAVQLILTVVGRFFKIYLLSAISPPFIACFVSDNTRQYGRNYVNAYVSSNIEGIVIALALIVYAGYAQNPLISFGDWGIFAWLGDAVNEMTYIYEQIFNMLLLNSIIKGADQLTHQIFA